jgi:hypothetical protein
MKTFYDNLIFSKGVVPYQQKVNLKRPVRFKIRPQKGIVRNLVNAHPVANYVTRLTFFGIN